MSFGIQADDLLECRAYVQLGNQVAISTRHYVVKGLDVDKTADDAAQGWSQQIVAPLKALISDQALFRGVSVQRLLPIPLSVAVWRDDDKATGLAAGDPLPTQTSGVITLRTHIAGRSRRGRQYVPFPTEGQSGADGNPLPAYLTDLETYGVALTEKIELGASPGDLDLEPVIFSRKLGDFVEVSSMLTRTGWGTQRRRGFFGSANLTPI